MLLKITCLSCPRALRAFVSQVTTCLRVLNYYLPMCPHFSRAFMCLHDNIYSLCLKLFRAYVRSFFTCLRACNQSQSILRLTSIPRMLFFFGILDLSFHSKPQNKLLLLKLHTSCGPIF